MRAGLHAEVAVIMLFQVWPHYWSCTTKFLHSVRYDALCVMRCIAQMDAGHMPLPRITSFSH